MGQDFHGNFQVNVTWFFAFFSGVLGWIVLILPWFERSLHSAQDSWQSCPWPLKLMMSHAVERTEIRTGGYVCLRGKWVKVVTQTQIVSFIIRLDCRIDREIPEQESADRGIRQAVLSLPCKQRFLFGIVFSICKVVHMACQSHSWFVCTPRETSAASHL